MRGVADYAIVYDISSDRERRKIVKLLHGYGFRVQKSVFECRLDRKGKDGLIRELGKLGLKTGFVKIYRLEYAVEGTVIGTGAEGTIDDGNAFVL